MKLRRDERRHPTATDSERYECNECVKRCTFVHECVHQNIGWKQIKHEKILVCAAMHDKFWWVFYTYIFKFLCRGFSSMTRRVAAKSFPLLHMHFARFLRINVMTVETASHFNIVCEHSWTEMAKVKILNRQYAQERDIGVQKKIRKFNLLQDWDSRQHCRPPEIELEMGIPQFDRINK